MLGAVPYQASISLIIMIINCDPSSMNPLSIPEGHAPRRLLFRVKPLSLPWFLGFQTGY